LHATSLQGEIINHPEKEHIVSKLKNLGFRYVSLDPEGYRTGSSNPEIKDI
jgi:PP-loop superfamily ATP-utilizing enzyme